MGVICRDFGEIDTAKSIYCSIIKLFKETGNIDGANNVKELLSDLSDQTNNAIPVSKYANHKDIIAKEMSAEDQKKVNGMINEIKRIALNLEILMQNK